MATVIAKRSSRCLGIGFSKTSRTLQGKPIGEDTILRGKNGCSNCV